MIATFKLDETYYKESLKEWISSVSKGRKYEPFLCALFALIGFGTLLFLPSFHITGYLAIGIALIESRNYIKFKKQWLKERLSSNLVNSLVELSIEKGIIKQIKPDSPNGLSFSLSRVISSKKGYFIYPKNGNFVYIPHSAISPSCTREEVIKILSSTQQEPII